ncbi:ty3-gypsy retrotransposon protein [Tanacetum coccineum]
MLALLKHVLEIILASFVLDGNEGELTVAVVDEVEAAVIFLLFLCMLRSKTRALSQMSHVTKLDLCHNEYFSLLNTPADQRFRIVGFNLECAVVEWFQWMTRNGLITTWSRFEKSVKNRFGPSKYEDPRGVLSKLLQLGTIEDYQREFEKLVNRVTDIPDSLLISFYISGLKLNLQHELLVSRPTTLGDVFFLARITEARFEAIADNEHNIKEKAYTTLTLPSEEASPVVKGPLDASEYTL